MWAIGCEMRPYAPFQFQRYWRVNLNAIFCAVAWDPEPDNASAFTDKVCFVEIKGQLGDAAIKKAAAERWCRAVNNDGRYGKWAYRLCFGAAELKGVFVATEHVDA